MATGFTELMQPAATATIPVVPPKPDNKSKFGNYTIEHFPDQATANRAAWDSWEADPSRDDKGRIHMIHDTGSMPELANSYAVVRAAPQYGIGDVVLTPTWHQDNRLGAHSITAVKPGFVYTKGINNAQGDGWTPIEQVYGRVERVYKGLKGTPFDEQ